MSPSDKPSSRRSWLRSGFTWSRRLGTLLVLLVATVVLALVVLWTSSGGYVARHVADLLNRKVFDENTRLSLDEVGGFPLDHLVLENVRLERRGPDGWYPFLAADRLRVSYDLWGIVHGRHDLRKVEADGLEFELRTDESGEYLLPSTGGGGGGAKKEGGFSGAIREVELNGGSLHIALPVRPLDLRAVRGTLSLELDAGDFRVDVGGLRGTLADDLGDVSLDGGAFVIQDGFAFREITGAWAGSPVTADGAPGGDNRDLTVTVGDFPLERLGRWLDRDNLAPGHVDTARVHLGQESGDLTLRWTGTGSWDLWRIDDSRGRGRLSADQLILTDVDGRVNGAEIAGARVEIPLANETLRVAGRFSDLQLQNMPLAMLEPYTGTFAGEAQVSLGDRGVPMASVTAGVSLVAGHVMEIPFRRARAVVRIENETVRLDTVRVSLAEAELHGGGRIGPQEMDLGFQYRGDLKPWRRLVNREDLEGTGRVDVLIQGPRDHPQLAASGSIRDLDVANFRIPRLALRRAEGTLAGGRHLDLDFLAPDGLSIAGTPFSRAEGSLVVTDSLLIMDSLQMARGDTTVTVVGNLAWSPQIEIEVERATVQLDGRSFEVARPARIVYDEGLLRAEGLTIATARGSITLSGDWNSEDNRVDVTAHLEDLDYSVFFPPDNPPSVRVGSATGDITMKGDFPLVDGGGTLELKAIEWDKGLLDSMNVVVRVEDRTIRLDRVDMRLGGGRASVHGSVELPQPIYGTMEAIAVGPDLDPTQIGLDLDGEVRGIRLADWFAFLDRRDRPSGRLDGRLQLTGTAAAPRFDAGLEAGAIVWRRFTADSVIVRGGFADGTLAVDTLTTWQNTRRVDISGTAPLDLTLYPFGWGLPDRDMDLLVDSEEGDLNNLKLTPWVDEAKGALKARIRITGTPHMPLLAGRAEVEGATIRPAKRDEVLENVRAVISFDRDLVTVEEARADLGGGTVSAEGTYRLHASAEQSYELKIKLDKAVARQEGTYAARVSGTLTLHPKLAKDGRVYPFAEGDLFVHRAEYAGSLEPQDVGQFEPQPVLYSVRINAPDQIIVATEDVNVVMGGEVTVRQDVDSRSILGELDILRGTYRLFLEEFQISQGTLTWNDPSTVLPEMDIQAETSVPPYRVVVSLTGRADEPVITFSAFALEDGSEAGLTQGEIIQLLAVGSVGLSSSTVGLGSGQQTENGGGAGTLERGLVGASGLFKGQIERQLARQIGLVDEVQIDTAFDEQGKFGATIGVRKWVTPELSIQYRQGLSRNFDQDLAVEYRLRRELFLRGEVLRRDQQGGAPTQQYNVDLKIRHEY